ncbi:MAG: hypothetical protein A2W22_05950 [Candidatus Levybacteria bacterium RBG_16_35_11]|nr:MAG: hypothetical protein A2W22_05950 [Candidatus Levybacteria bacterium RBG_16_35_11]
MIEQSPKQIIERKLTEIDFLIGEDSVDRRVSRLRRYLKTDLRDATEALLDSENIYICTGFVIPSGETIETDGLSGAFFLGRALKELGKTVTFLLDDNSAEVIRNVNSSMQDGFNLRHIDRNFMKQYDYPVLEFDLYSNIINRSKKTALIAIGRPGLGGDNQYRNMAGDAIPNHPLDAIFYYYLGSHNVRTISCADGLNELGMGKLPKGLIRRDRQIQSVIKVDDLIVGGTADWATFGLIAALSLYSGKDLLPTSTDQSAYLKAVSEAGAVDGITRKRELTVDALPLSRHIEKVQQLRSMICPKVALDN